MTYTFPSPKEEGIPQKDVITVNYTYATNDDNCYLLTAVEM